MKKLLHFAGLAAALIVCSIVAGGKPTKTFLLLELKLSLCSCTVNARSEDGLERGIVLLFRAALLVDSQCSRADHFSFQVRPTSVSLKKKNFTLYRHNGRKET